MRRLDLTGYVFGKLTAVSFVGTIAEKGGTRALWLCRCECGREAVVRGSVLRGGGVKSCGCLKNLPYTRTHGCTGTKLYHVWQGIIARTTRPKNKRWESYGGRGIAICDEWRADFVAFQGWALANGYEPGLEIHRKDNDGNYEPGNCEWLTHEEHMAKHGKGKSNG